MFGIGDTVMHPSEGVCSVEDIRTIQFSGGQPRPYYVLHPTMEKGSSTVYMPTDRGDTVLRLAEIPNVLGLKDATGDIGRGIMLLRSLPEGFSLYSGDDPSAGALMLLGACGNISVTANVIPAIMARLCEAARCGDVETVREISIRIAPLHEAMFVEANPIPVKWAIERILSVPAHYRLPLTSLAPGFREQVATALHSVLPENN